jgi:hypothetical protein
MIVGGPATVINTTFLNNIATNGVCGGACFDRAATVTGSIFKGNVANGYGGGAYFGGFGSVWTGDFVNTLFAANHAGSKQGAGLYVYNDGGDDVVTLRHVTITSPTVGSGSAVYVLSSTLHITNTIVGSYSVGLERVAGAVSENYNLFSGVTTPYSGTVSSGGNSLTGTAAFANTTHYKLTVASAARDAGTNVGVTTDFEGDPRPLDAGFDIGWDEANLSFLYLPVMTK